MATVTIPWNDGSGNITVTYGGYGDGTIVVTSDDNNLHTNRSKTITIKTTDGSNISRTVTVEQVAKPYIDLSNAVVTAANQTYSGSAKTPVPTVTLNGETVPSTGYDVSYSNNTNAGTATITVTGKGDYSGTATGYFAIAKANPAYTAPVASSLTYNGSSQYLITTGSTGDGTIYYSSNGTSWSTTRPSGTDAGTYTAYWKLTGDSNHTDISATQVSGVSIAQATGEVATAPTAIDNLTYTGSSQYLVTAGSGTGTMYYRYKLSTSSSWSSWSTSRPSRTDAGTYNIEYYAASSTNYTQSATGSLNAVIAQASRTLSFANDYVIANTSSTVTNTATPSAGSGTITYTISNTTYATINSSTGAVTTKTSDGTATVTATIAASGNYGSATASYTLYVFATVHNFDYTGSVQSITLPVGSYKLQCWGAQGGSNAAASTYSITAQEGGKGGYSEGILTVEEPTTVYAFVGGQGASSGNGGWNGGGGGSGSSSYNSGGTNGVSRMGCGGGATDFALTTSTMGYSSYRTNRSSASLLSRIIVAGGGSGGAMCYKAVTTSVEKEVDIDNADRGVYTYGNLILAGYTDQDSKIPAGKKCKIVMYGAAASYVYQIYVAPRNSSGGNLGNDFNTQLDTPFTAPNKSGQSYISLIIYFSQDPGVSIITYHVIEYQTDTETTTSNDSQVGFAGGGTTGEGYSSTYKGKQNAAGSGGSFGQGANQTATNYRYCSGAGGGGWYGGGGGTKSNSTMNYVKYSGGGSGFVNTSANASYRPSGYNGIELDSGSTTAGSSSFPAPDGGTETGHSGNGYARITRLS